MLPDSDSSSSSAGPSCEQHRQQPKMSSGGNASNGIGASGSSRAGDAGPSSPSGRSGSNGHLPYATYQSHRRTASTLSASHPSSSSKSVPVPSSLLPSFSSTSSKLPAPSPLVSDSGTERYAGSNFPAARSSSSPATGIPDQSGSNGNPRSSDGGLSAPPPLRKLRPAGRSEETSTSARQAMPRDLHTQPHRSLVVSPNASNTSVKPNSLSGPSSRSSTPSSSSHMRSPSLPQASTSMPPPAEPPRPSRPAKGPESAFTHSRSPTLPSNLDRLYNLPAASKGPSTAQALRIKELQDTQRRKGSFNGGEHTPSTTASGSSSRAHSPAPTTNGIGRSPSLGGGFEAMYALQQQQQQQQGPALPIQRAGFQPRGVSRSQMLDFVEARRAAKSKQKRANSMVVVGLESEAENSGRYEERIRRRVEKLLAIHYPTTAADVESALSATPTSFRSSLLSTLATRSRFLTALQNASTVRALEQSLVPWQSDEGVQACPICSRPFGFGRRRHHCRACGRVICASPDVENSGQATNSSENVPCSNIVIKDEQAASMGGQGVLAIKDLPSENALEMLLAQGHNDGTEKTAARLSLADQDKGFRICKDCRALVFKSQYMQEENALPQYVQLYDQLMSLQSEIEQSLPEFQELVMGLQRQDSETTLGVDAASTPEGKASKAALLQLQRDAATARKQLLANFANYDALARRIGRLDDEGNVSLRKVKEAIERKAGVFLQANMFPLQSLPKFESQHKRAGSKASTRSSTPSIDAAVVAQVTVLREQRDQIAGFLTRAQKERKLNDVVLLKRNLEELDQEIMRLEIK